MSGFWGGWDPDTTVRQAMAYGASQDPWELGQAIASVAALHPAVVVEIGCDRGGTLYAWRQVCDRVLGITLADNSMETGGSGFGLETHGAAVMAGDSHDPVSLAWLVRQLRSGAWSCVRDHRTEPCGECEGCRWAQNEAVAASPVDALVIDGDHSAAGIRTDLAMYGPLVRVGGLILLHDIHSQPQASPPVEVAAEWPGLVRRYATSEIHNPKGGFGWGLIHVGPGDTFGETDG